MLWNIRDGILMSKKQKNLAAKAGIGYTIGNYCLKGIGFITVPIFARILTTADFGIYNTFLAYESILYIFISLTLHGSLKSAKYKFKNNFDSYISSLTIMPQLIMVGCVLCCIFCRVWLAEKLGINNNVIFFLVIYSYCSGVIIFYKSRISLEFNYKQYLKMSMFNVLCSVFLSLVLIHTMFNQERYMGRIVGGTISYLVLTGYILINLYKKALPRFNKEYWIYGLKISIPLIPHGLSQILLMQFDRIMINKLIGNAEAGIYSFSYTIYSLIQITGTSLDTAFSNWVFKQLHEYENKEEVKKIGTCFMLFLAGIVTVVMLFSPEVIRILGGEKYKESIYSTIPVVFAGFFALSYVIPSVMEYYYEKTGYIALGTSIAALLNVVLNAVFIPQYGYIAAAYTTLISYIFYYTLHTCISRKLSGFFIIKQKYFFVALLIVCTSFIISLKFVDVLLIRIITAVILVFIGIILLIKVYGYEKCKQIMIRGERCEK